MTPASHARLKLGLIAALFLVPVATAWLLYLNPELRPGGRLNHGTLIEPARTLPDLPLESADGPAPAALRGKWTLLYLGAAQCDRACEERLVLARQARTLLNQNRGRVQRVYLAPGAAAREAARAQLAAAHPDLVFVSDASGRTAAVFADAGARDPHALELLDPNGVWLMRYQGSFEYKGLLKDLKRLLRFSSVG